MDKSYPRFRRNFYVKARTLKAKWQEEIEANKQEYLRDACF